MTTKQELIAFEDEVAEAFSAGRIRAPIHLAGGNEDQLIELFRQVKPTDWVFASYRQHYHALLHGVPREQVMAEILAGRSMQLTFPEHRFYSWAIVGGLSPIAVGVAAALKRAGNPAMVWCFMGDMASRMGLVYESVEYAANFHLPIRFVIEDNQQACGTPTAAVWGADRWGHKTRNVYRYDYQLSRPHVGVGKWIAF